MPAAGPLRTPAKLNWTLEVLGRRADGFHELRSWFVAAALCDALQAAPIAGPSTLTVTGPFADGIPTDASNLILQAESAWRAAGGEAPTLAWHLEKNIPHAAGLGGGSGNAAAALRWLEHFATRQADRPLTEIALALGSDVPFFLLDHGACLLGGRGEVLLDHAQAPAKWVVLAIPAIAVPTGPVFQALAAAPLPTEVQAGVGTSTAPPFPEQPGPNHLLPAACQAVPALAAFASALAEVGDFHLSGSGGTFFHVAESEQAAQEIAARVAEKCHHVEVVPLLAGPVLSRVQ